MIQQFKENLKKNVTILKIYMFIRKVNERISLKVIIKKNSEYLKKGTYHLMFGSKPIIFQKSHNSLMFISSKNKHINNKRFFISRFDRLFNVSVKTNNNGTFGGELLMLTLTHNVKIFNFQNREMITIFKEKENYKKVALTNKILSPYFKTTIINTNDDTLTTLESVIDYKPYNLMSNVDKKNIFEDLNMRYENYFKNINENNIYYSSLESYLESFKKKSDNKHILSDLKKYLNSSYLLSLEIPKIYLHGDMHLGNVLISNDNFYLIDFECGNLYFFLFDFLNFIFAESISRNNSDFLDSYINNKYDQYLEDIFGIFNFPFEKNDKKLYLLIFFLEKVSSYGMSKDLLFFWELIKVIK